MTNTIFDHFEAFADKEIRDAAHLKHVEGNNFVITLHDNPIGAVNILPGLIESELGDTVMTHFQCQVFGGSLDATTKRRAFNITLPEPIVMTKVWLEKNLTPDIVIDFVTSRDEWFTAVRFCLGCVLANYFANED